MASLGENGTQLDAVTLGQGSKHHAVTSVNSTASFRDHSIRNSSPEPPPGGSVFTPLAIDEKNEEMNRKANCLDHVAKMHLI